jgi:hypothetical protein
MRFHAKILYIASLFLSEASFAQPFIPLNNDFNYFIENALTPSTDFHSSIRPYNFKELQFDTLQAKLPLNVDFLQGDRKVAVLPIAMFDVSKSFHSDNGASFGVGAGVKAKFGKRWYIQANLSENLSKFPFYVNEKMDTNKIIPHWGRYTFQTGNFFNYPSITGLLEYTPRRYLSLTLGYDKNFIGDGYRSLLLSDNSAPYPFAKLTVHAWRIKYYAMLTVLRDVNTSVYNSNLYSKYGIFHYLSINVSKRFNLGFYENIIWRGRDSADSRGIELAYLNPMVFYRPIEASFSSPDNAAIGASGKLRLWNKTFMYGQFLLDDFRFQEVLANKGWWGTKYALQAGLKTFNFLNIQNLYLQVEFNFAKPFTYSHVNSLTNMGNMYQPLTHPLGANFYELIQVIRYGKGQWWLSLKGSSALYGQDVSNTDYGMNIYKSYDLRNSNYGVYTLQGERTYLANYETSFNFMIKPKWNMAFQLGYKLYSKINNTESVFGNYVFVRLSTLLYNNETDY